MFWKKEKIDINELAELIFKTTIFNATDKFNVDKSEVIDFIKSYLNIMLTKKQKRKIYKLLKPKEDNTKYKKNRKKDIFIKRIKKFKKKYDKNKVSGNDFIDFLLVGEKDLKYANLISNISEIIHQKFIPEYVSFTPEVTFADDFFDKILKRNKK